MDRADFEATAEAQIRVHDSETGGSSGVPVDGRWGQVAGRAGYRSGSPVVSARAQHRGRRFGQFVRQAGRGLRRGGTLASPVRYEVRSFSAEHREPVPGPGGSRARRSPSRWPRFSTRLWSPARGSPSRVRPRNTPRGQTSRGMRTASAVAVRPVRPALQYLLSYCITGLLLDLDPAWSCYCTAYPPAAPGRAGGRACG